MHQLTGLRSALQQDNRFQHGAGKNLSGNNKARKDGLPYGQFVLALKIAFHTPSSEKK